MTSKLTNAFHGVPLSRLLGYGAGGLGLAALENQYVGTNLPDPLKKINDVIGAGTGAMLASHNPEMQTAALGSIPIKEMGLFAVGGLDRFRRQQQSLVDTNLDTARINQSAAKITRDDAGGKKLMALAFLAPALAAGGGIAANSYLNWKAKHKPKSKFQTDATNGEPKPSQRIRIDMPPSALPKSFYEALGSSTRDSRDFTRVQSKRPMTKASSQQPTVGGMLRDLVWQGTGIPSIHNAWREAGYGMNTAQNGDYHNAARYGASALADAGLGALALRYGVAPAALRLFGRGRIGGVLRNAAKPGLANRMKFEFPWAAKAINRYGGGHELGPAHFSPEAPGISGLPDSMAKPDAMMGASGPRTYVSGAGRNLLRQQQGMNTRSPLRRALDIHGAYDSSRYNFENPTVGGIAGRLLGSNPNARSLPGHIMEAGRYGLNRGVNALYAGKQYIKRHPLLTGSIGLPLVAAHGVAEDEVNRQNELSQSRPWFPDSTNNEPSGQWMPASTMASNLLGAFGAGNPMAPLRRQFGG